VCCGAGEYASPGDTSCSACPAGTYSASGAADCTSCPAGKYSNASGASECSGNCAAGTYSLTTGATKSSVCIPRCGPGFFSTSTGEAEFYSGTCFPCPLGSDAPSGSTTPTNCTCAAGFFGPAGGPCEPCPSGTYKAEAGSAAFCTSCPISGQWSPTRSVSSSDCMVIPKATVSEVCPKPPVQHFGEPRFKRCRLPWTWDDLYAGHHNGSITYYQGSLGMLRVTGRFETWVCLKGDPCANDLTDTFFCYVYEEQERKFVPWGPNVVLRLLTMPVTQDEVLHLRAENKEIKAENKEIKAENKKLKAKDKKLEANLTALNNEFEEFKAWKATMTSN